jgi:hypothetical protein
MPIALSVTVYSPGAGGVPTTTVLASLGGRIDDYEHTITDEIGFDSMRCTFAARDLVECVEWMNQLGASVVVSDPEGRTVWEGLLYDVDVSFGRKTTAVSLDDVANSVRVKYSADSGAQAATSDVTSAASIARYGTKMRAINFSTATAAAASARAAVVLSQIAWPRSKQSGGAETGSGGGGASITLQFRGWWHTLDWLLLSSSSTTTTQTSAQVATLLAAYNATNAFFSTSTANITATGVSDTEFVESETTYAEQIPKLLASGNSSSQRVVFGVYEGRALTVGPWAAATPSTITYYESDRDQVIRDAYGNVVESWALRPNAMSQLVDLVEPAPASGPIDTLTRRYIKRVSCRISRSGVSGTLEPDDVDSIEELLTRPTGGTTTGTSDRQNKIERAIAKPARTRFSGTDGTVDLGGGSITTGGGTIDLTSGGGTVTLPSGGGTITLPPPSGGGNSSLLDGSGTAGQLAKWSAANTLGNATAGSDYATGGHTHTATSVGGAPIGAKYIVQQADADLTNEQSLGLLTTGLVKNTVTAAVGVLSTAVAGTDYVAPGSLNETIDDRVAALLTEGANITLTYNDAANTLTIAAAGSVGGTGTAGRLAQWNTGGADITNSTLIKSGTGVLTLATASNTMTLTLGASGGTLNLAGGTLTLGPDLTTSGAGSTITLSAAGAYTLTIPKTGTAVVGAGASGGVAFFTDANTLASDDTNLYWDAINNRLGIGDAAPAYALVVGGETRLKTYASVGAVAPDSNIGLLVRGRGTSTATRSIRGTNSSGTTTFDVYDSGEIATGAAVRWDLGSYTAGAPTATGYVTVSVAGTTRKLLAG